MQTIQRNTQSTRGRKKGSKEVQLKPSNEWVFLKSCKNFINFIINEGRHIKLHISGKKSEQRRKIYQVQQGNQDTYNNVEELVRKYFSYTISNQNKVIYFFRDSDSPRKSINDIIMGLIRTQHLEGAMNLEQQVQNPQIAYPVPENREFTNLLNSSKQNQQRSLNTFTNEQNSNSLYSDGLAQLQQQNKQEPKYEQKSDQLQQQNTQKYNCDGQQYDEKKSEHSQEQNTQYNYQCQLIKSDHLEQYDTQKPSNNFQCNSGQSAQESSNNQYLEIDEFPQLLYSNTQKPQLLKRESFFQDLDDDNCLMFPIQNNDTNKLEITLQQNNSQQIEYENTSRNPFLLDFIDPDLAKILDKSWHLFEEEFIFELIVMFDARQKNMDVTNVLLNMATENNNFSQILQNIFIKKIINKNICINEFRNEKLESFREKFQKHFEQAKNDVENFLQQIHQIVKLGEDTEYQEDNGTPIMQTAPQKRQGQELKSGLQQQFEQSQVCECKSDCECQFGGTRKKLKI